MAFGRKKKEPTLKHSEIITLGDIQEKAKEYLNKGGEIVIYENSDSGIKMARKVLQISLYLSLENIESYIQSELGAGLFTIAVRTQEKRNIVETTIGIGKIKKSSSHDESEAKGQSSQYMNPTQVMDWAMKMAEKFGNGNHGSMSEAFTIAEKAFRNPLNDKISEAVVSQLMAPADPLEQLDKWTAIIQRLQQNPSMPLIQQPDVMSQLLNGIIQIAGPFVLQRLGILPQSIPQLAGLSQATSPTPPGNPGSLAQPQAIQQLPSTTLPMPSEPGGVPPLQSNVSSKDAPPVQAAVDPVAEHHQDFYNAWIKTFQRMIEANIPASELARHVLEMITYEVRQSWEEPHPLVAKIINSETMDQAEAGYLYFCNAIPQLSQRKDLQAEIRGHLLAGLSQLMASIAHARESIKEQDDEIELERKQNIADDGPA